MRARKRGGSILILASIVAAVVGGPAPRTGAADVEVGVGKPFAKIADALAAANPDDRVVVFSGTYDEQFTWAKDVDIVEAPGETAVLRPTDALSGPFLIDIILGAGMEVSWEGIDLVYASTKFSRIFMNRVGAADAVVTIQDISATDDDALSGGTKGRAFTAETGTMELINCTIAMDNPNGYEMIVGAVGGTLSVINSSIAGSGDRTIFSEGSLSVLNITNCSVTRTPTNYTAFLSDLLGGTVNIVGCTLTANSENTARGVLLRGGKSTLNMERTVVDGGANWWPFAIENGSKVTLTNVAVVKNPNRGGVQFAIWTNGLGMDLTLRHCTFSSTADSSGNTVIIDESNGSAWTLTAENNLFHLPATTFGAIRANPAGGLTTQTNGTNLRFVGTGSAASDLFTQGTILEDDPLLAADGIHLKAGSPAIGAADASDVDEDIDGENRPLQGFPDLGADEFSQVAPVPPNPPSNVSASGVPAGIDLTWIAPTSGPAVTGYNVYRVRPEPAEKVNALPLTATTLSITGLQPVEQCFVVRSLGEGLTPLESVDSNEACAIPEAVPAPNAPTNLAATGGERQITLTWEAPVGGGDVASYAVVRTRPGALAIVGTAPADATTIVLPGMPGGREFCFRLRARGVTGLESPDSNEACATASALSTAVDREVGVGKTYATITAALAAAVDGDRVVVFSGEYDEQFGWGKLVDIVEAPGETAVLHPTDDLVGGFLMDMGGQNGYITWEGIDLRYDSTKFVRLFLKRGDNRSSVIFRNFKVTDVETAAGAPRVFAHELGGMILENVEVDLVSSGLPPKGYQHVVSVIGNGINFSATDCSFEAAGDMCVYSEGAAGSNAVTLTRCLLNRKTTGYVAFLTDLTDGIINMNDCRLTGGIDTARGILCRYGGSQPVNLTMNRCTWDPDIPWYPVAFEKPVVGTFTNCCFAKDPAQGGAQFSVLHNNATGAVNSISSLTFRHCTFSATAENSANTGIIDETSPDRRLELEVENCVFHLPGSTMGAIRRNNTTDTTEVIAGTNLRYLGPAGSAGLTQADLLEQDPAGVLVEEDPLLAADFCHLLAGSPAIDAGADLAVVVADDIDGDSRPIGAKADLGCDEWKQTGTVFRRGDADAKGGVPNITDAIYVLNYLFLGGSKPPCLEAADADNKGGVNITDGIYILNYLFQGGNAPPAPGPDVCGPDTDDPGSAGDLGCETYDFCAG